MSHHEHHHSSHTSSFANASHSYARAVAWGDRVNKFNELRRFHHLEGHLAVMNSGIELASVAQHDRDRDALVAFTLEAAQSTKGILPLVHPHNSSKVAAVRFMANMPALITQKVYNAQPSVNQLNRAYSSHREDLLRMYNEVRRTLPPATETLWTYEGQVAESIVLLSLQKYALDTFEDTSWLPLPATGHEDSTNARGSWLQPTWDISVNTYLGSQLPSTPAYKVQVKRSWNGHSQQERYEDDISMIYVKNDMALPYEIPSNYDTPSVSIGRLMNEMGIDAPQRSAERWDIRTQQILDILD